MKGPLGPSVSIIKSQVEVLHCHHTGTCAAVFSVHVSAVLCCAQGGSRLYPFALGFRKGDDPVTVEGPGTGRLQRGICRCWHRCISLIHSTSLRSFERIVGGLTLCLVAEY